MKDVKSHKSSWCPILLKNYMQTLFKTYNFIFWQFFLNILICDIAFIMFINTSNFHFIKNLQSIWQKWGRTDIFLRITTCNDQFGRKAFRRRSWRYAKRSWFGWGWNGQLCRVCFHFDCKELNEWECVPLMNHKYNKKLVFIILFICWTYQFKDAWNLFFN